MTFRTQEEDIRLLKMMREKNDEAYLEFTKAFGALINKKVHSYYDNYINYGGELLIYQEFLRDVIVDVYCRLVKCTYAENYRLVVLVKLFTESNVLNKINKLKTRYKKVEVRSYNYQDHEYEDKYDDDFNDPASLQEYHNNTNVEEIAIVNILLKEYNDIISTLDQMDKDIIDLKSGEFTNEQISQVLHISISKVKNRLNVFRNKVKSKTHTAQTGSKVARLFDIELGKNEVSITAELENDDS